MAPRIYSFTAVPLLDVAIDQQVTEWCLVRNRHRYEALLGCPSREGVEQLQPSCGPECSDKLELLKKMGGCRFLHRRAI